jgi:hypothetical protein
VSTILELTSNGTGMNSQTTSSRSRSGNVATDKAAIAVRFNVRPGILNSREKMDEESKR